MVETSLVNELKKWDKDCFTTTSELLGEIEVILEQIANLDMLDNITRIGIHHCITAINKAFRVPSNRFVNKI